MPCWNGLGLNYKSINPVLIAQDIAYFKSIGLGYIRPHIPSISNGDTEISLWRDIAKTFHDEGFYVQWGITSSDLTSSNWTTYANEVKAQAALCQSGSMCDEFGIGNELELHHDESITDSQIRSNLRTLATEVQSIFTRGPVSYQVCQDTNLNDWISDDDLGGLDLIAVNTYGIYLDGKFSPTYKTNIVNLLSAFGNQGYISEFNLDAYDPRFQSIPEDLAIRETAVMMDYIKNSGVLRASFFQWRGFKDGDNAFSVRMNTEEFKTMWQPLANNNGRRWLI